MSKSFAATVTGGQSAISTFYEMYSYDSAGRVLKKRLRIVNPQLGTVDKDIEYNFTAAKLNTVKYPDVNVPFTYYYDNMLRPNRMTGKDPNDFQAWTNTVDYVNSVNYNVASRITSMWVKTWAGFDAIQGFGAMLHETLHFLGINDPDIGNALTGGPLTSTDLYSARLAFDCWEGPK